MGRRKDLKRRQGNAAGTERNRLREAQAAGGGTAAADPAAADPADENECPKCGAKAGEACVTPSGNPTKTHKARG